MMLRHTHMTSLQRMNVRNYILPFGLLCITMLSNPSTADGQSLTEEEAVIQALSYGPSIHIADLEIKKNKVLERTAFNLPQPEIAIETPADNGPGVEVEQNFDFPLVYTRRHGWLKQKTALSVIEAQISRRELRRNVRLAYLEAQIAFADAAYQAKQDSLWHFIVSNSHRYFDAGQINRADLLASERYANLAGVASKQANLVLENALKTLGQYTGTIPASIDPVEMLSRDGSVQSGTYYFEKELMQARDVTAAEIKWHRAERWPGFLIGYTRASEPETAYNNRLKAGITIPLWQGQYTGEIKAARITLEQQQYQRDWMLSQSRNRQLQLEETIAQTKDALDWFYQEGLANVETEGEVANRLFEGGEMDLNWVLRTRTESAGLYRQFLETLKQHNTTVIELEFLLEN